MNLKILRKTAFLIDNLYTFLSNTHAVTYSSINQVYQLRTVSPPISPYPFSPNPVLPSPILPNQGLLWVEMVGIAVVSWNQWEPHGHITPGGKPAAPLLPVRRCSHFKQERIDLAGTWLGGVRAVLKFGPIFICCISDAFSPGHCSRCVRLVIYYLPLVNSRPSVLL